MPEAYLLGSSAAELEHLVAQAEVYAPEANELLNAIGLESGASAIDVGCGVLGILHLLASRVGPGGRVVGLDREPRILELASTLAEQRGVTAKLIEGDAAQTGLAAETFDFVHARTLLLNVADPEAVLTEMIRLAKPGGTVAVQEPDSAGWVCDPPHPSWELLRSALTDAYRASGKDFDIGRRTGRLLRDSGLDHVHVRVTARVTKPGDYYQTFLPTLVQLVADQILLGGALNAEQLDAHVKTLGAHLSAPTTITCQPLIWQAWGTRTGPAPRASAQTGKR
jgi:ubiquinone/menaquinone biosynthesis C-methylase UbiE